MVSLLHRPTNGQGWQLELKQVYDRKKLVPHRRPLVIIPGYGMNSFIFGFHPNGLSMEEFFSQAGFEVWSANLRGQGGSKRLGGSRNYGFKELSLVDLPCVFDTVLAHTRTRADRLDAIGCSLGATLLYAYLAHHPKNHPLGALIPIGGPLRWERAHPFMRAAFFSPLLAGAIPMYGTRHLARAALPLLAKRFPRLLSIYMNASIVDTSRAEELTRTVEDPHPYLNRQIAHWVKTKDLIVAGRNVTHALAEVNLPVLCVLANQDGIVTREAALSIRDAIGTKDVSLLEVGDAEIWFAHADLFISRHCHQRVFAPIRDWLLAHYETTPIPSAKHGQS